MQCVYHSTTAAETVREANKRKKEKAAVLTHYVYSIFFLQKWGITVWFRGKKVLE